MVNYKKILVGLFFIFFVFFFSFQSFPKHDMLRIGLIVIDWADMLRIGLIVIDWALGVYWLIQGIYNS